MKILIDKDGVLYDLHVVWGAAHNKRHGKIHQLQTDDITDWDITLPCKGVNCPGANEMFDYLQQPKLWIDGETIPGSQDITRQWVRDGHELVVITKLAGAVAAKPGLDWLEIFFPHIPDVMLVTGEIKHWAIADILIDDSERNHMGFQGISILMDQPWNRRNQTLIRARDWLHVEAIVNRAEAYINHYTSVASETAHELYAHKWIEGRLKLEVDAGEL
jgi:5'(3')-deoxyribonucleotidase